MTKMTKRMRNGSKGFDPTKVYTLGEAVEALKAYPPVKFDQSIDLSLKLTIDPKKNEQQVRGTVSLPHGTGKKVRVLVFAKGEKVKEAYEAGADYAGFEDFLAKVQEGWVDFDVVISTPDLMREVGKLGKVLGPRGLMPTPKGGTVTQEVGKATRELKSGKIEFKNDKQGMINKAIGKLSFTKEALLENITTLLDAVKRIKPASAKGLYMETMVISSTMGPGLSVDLRGLGY